jgi:hypothetical protein
MSYKPDEKDLMAYLYGELEGAEKEKMERYLLDHPEERRNLEALSGVRTMLRTLEDKEVIAPPLFLNDTKQRSRWEAPYLKTILSIAASLVVVILVGKYSGITMSYANHEFRLSFGSGKNDRVVEPVAKTGLTPEEVQWMINQSLEKSNSTMLANLEETQARLDASIRKNLALNSGKMDQLVREVSSASQEQIRQYVANLQNENMALVRDYLQLNAGEQKQYIETMLVDFAKYLHQQRRDDLQLVQMRLNSLEQNTSVFKEETEQILTSIISTVGQASHETKY